VYTKSEIEQNYLDNKMPDEDIPFNLEKTSIVNSELKYESWFIENPMTQELTKRITLKLGANSTQDFVIVVRCPLSKKPVDLLSVVNVGLLTYSFEKFGVKDSFEDCLKYHYNNNMKNFLTDRKHLAQEQKASVLLAAKLVVPKLVCPKEFWVEKLNSQQFGP